MSLERVEADAAPRLLAAGPRDPSRALRRPRERPAPCSGRSARRRSWRRSSSSRSRARGATSSRPPTSCRACAGSATSIGVLLVFDEIQSGIGPDGQDVRLRALGRRRRHRLPGQGDRQRPAAGRDRRPGLGDGLAQRQPCLDVRRQPGRLRGVAGDAPAGREPLSCQRRPARPASSARASNAWPTASRSSARSGASA